MDAIPTHVPVRPCGHVACFRGILRRPIGAEPDASGRHGCEREAMANVVVPAEARAGLVDLGAAPDLWERAFTVAPLVLIGTKEGDGWDFAPKHQAMPLGWEGFYCFACTPRHATYRNLRAHPQFTVSYPGPEQIVASSLAAGGRYQGGAKPSLAAIPTSPARVVDGRVVAGCPLYLECELERIVDGFGSASLIVGRVVAAFAAREAVRGTEVDDADLVHRLGLLAYLVPGRFAAVRESLSYPYPVDFRR
jgi:flavin reductase (DIM6/NTAB) family NADH-FMN oxidoreductase RutF